MRTEALTADIDLIDDLIDALAAEGDDAPEAGAERPFVTPQRLIALGIFSNAMFWSGLLLPFNAHSLPWIPVLHAYVAMIGLALALGSAVATVLMAVHQVNTRLFSPHMIAAVMHFTVVIAMGTLLGVAFVRGWLG